MGPGDDDREFDNSGQSYEADVDDLYGSSDEDDDDNSSDSSESEDDDNEDDD